MSLSVERLKELLSYETEWLAMFDHAALVRGMADLETRTAALHRDAARAYSELIAIKEAQPVAEVCVNYSDDDRYKRTIDYSPTEIDSIAIGTQLIIKPE